MKTPEEKHYIQNLWERNYLNIRKSTQLNSSTQVKSIVVGFELYEVSVDANNKMYPMVLDTLKLLSNCPAYNLYIWTNSPPATSRWFVDNVFIPNGIKIKGVNEGIFVKDPNYSPVKPWIDVLIDRSAGFDPTDWYWTYQVFRVSQAILYDKDDSVKVNIIKPGAISK